MLLNMLGIIGGYRMNTEEYVKFIFSKMKEQLGVIGVTAKISKVAVWETPTSRATYYED